jgi:hypothetical protein
MSEFVGEDKWNEITLDNKGTLHGPLALEHSYRSTKRIFTLGVFHFRRKSILTSRCCYQLRWGFGSGKGTQRLNENIRNQRRRAIFLRQNFLTTMDWRLKWNYMKRKIPKDLLEKPNLLIRFFRYFENSKMTPNEHAHVTKEFHELDKWLKDQYPEITVDLHRIPQKTGYSYLISGIFLQLVVTAILGALTKFSLGSRKHAPWFLVWIYGGPMLRWTWLNDESLDKELCLSARKWIFFGFTAILSLALLVAVYGGISSICVELLASICNTTFLFPAYIWLLIAVMIALTFATIGLLVTYFSSFAGD